MPAGTAIRVATRVSGFTYAIRNIVVEAKKVEAAGRAVRYLNIGDPIPFGFRTPEPIVEAVARALRDNLNGYAPSAGIEPARRAVAAEWTGRGMPVSPDRVVITSGTSEGIELALGALADAGDEVLVPTPTYPLYTAVLAKIGARPAYYRTDPSRGWEPDRGRRQAPDHTGDAGDRRHRSEQPDRRGVLGSDATRAHRHCRSVRRADSGRRGVRGPRLRRSDAAPARAWRPMRRSSRSRRCRRASWRPAGAPAGSASANRIGSTTSSRAIKKLADGRLCSPGPMQYGIAAALTGDRAASARRSSPSCGDALISRWRASAAIPGLRCVAPRAAFYVMPQVTLPPGTTDEDFVIGLLRATGILCVYGSGFGMPADQGFFRIVFLASPEELGRDLRRPGRRSRRSSCAARRRPRAPVGPGVTGSDQREHRLMIWAIAGLLIGAVTLWLLYLVRGVLLLVYVSTLLAIGFSPAVHWFERGASGWLRTRMSRGCGDSDLLRAVRLFVVICCSPSSCRRS